MIETAIVVGIVETAIVLIARSIYRTTSGEKNNCTCGDSCPIADICENKTTPL